MQLVRFLMKMTSEYVQVELKDGTVVAGMVASVAPNMNTTLKDVKMTALNEDPLVMDTITLRGNSIRYFMLPDAINLDAMITDDTRKPRSHLPPVKRKRPDPSVGPRGNHSGRGGRFHGNRGGYHGPRSDSRGDNQGEGRHDARNRSNSSDHQSNHHRPPRGGRGAGRGHNRQILRGRGRGRGRSDSSRDQHRDPPR